MNNFEKKNRLPKIYHITGLIAFIYSALLIVFTIYKEFFYVDGTWLHGFTANGFAILSNLIWIGFVFFFKQFLSKVFNYTKANLLINIYLFLLGISAISIASVLYKSVKVYSSLENADQFNALIAFASTSISGAIFLFLSNFVAIFICILLGNQIRSIVMAESKLFIMLGYSFIAYGILYLLTSITLLDSDIFQLSAKAAVVILTGLIFNKAYSMDYAELSSSQGFDNTKTVKNIKPKTQDNVKRKTKSTTTKPVFNKKNDVYNDKSKKNNFQKEEIPSINLNEIEDKELVLSYYENLPQEELNRLEYIVVKKWNQDLNKEQKTNLVMKYIIENKLYDHQRFLPK